MSGVKSTIFLKISLIACGTVLALLGSEFLLRAFDVDLRLLRKTLYYQCGYPKLHKTSSDAQRLFELVPNTFDTPSPNHMDPKSINALGFRGRGFAPKKKAGVFRIVVFGGSNTFGAFVNDEETYPAQMQRIFDEKYPGKVEVWNAGISAYVMSQDVAYAETVIKKFAPDLVILQDTNVGRRAFYGNVTLEELKKLFDKNNELFKENIPFLWRQNVSATEKVRFFLVSLGSKMHYSLVRVSALYRVIYVSFFSYCLDVLSHHPDNPIKKKYLSCFFYPGKSIGNRELNSFTERHKDKKIILFFLTDSAQKVGHSGVEIGDNVEMRNNMEDFVLNAKDKPPEYLEIHPPSYVYAWYARELCNFLAQKGYIPANILDGKEMV